MALYNPEVSTTASPPPHSEDEIDLREFVYVLIGWWREILLFSILLTGLVTAFLLFQRNNAPILYEANATVVVARVYSDVNFQTGVQTRVDSGAASVQGGAPRRATLVALVHNGQIAQAVRDELQDMEGMEFVTAAHLMNWVSASSLTLDNQTGDLIEIRVTTRDPEIAAAVANAWANRYVKHVNSIYGQMPAEIVEAVAEQRDLALGEYETAQSALEVFIGNNSIVEINREINNRQNMISTLRSTQDSVLSQVISESIERRMTTIAAYLNAQSNNRLLAFRREQEANRTLLNDLINIEIDNRRLALQTEQDVRATLFKQYVNAEMDNRLLALQTEQDVRATLFKQYVNAEMNNRLLALRTEQEQKSRIFSELSTADLDARMTIYNQQLSSRVSELTARQNDLRRFERLLADSRSLQSQVAQSNGANLQSNLMSLNLLKTQAFAASQSLPGQFQISLDSLDLSATTADELVLDLATLVINLENRIVDLETAIAVKSDEILNNTDYLLLTDPTPADEALHTLVQESYMELFGLGELALMSNEISESQLATAIVEKYDELFGLGELALMSNEISESQLAAVIVNKYDELFQAGQLISTSLALGVEISQDELAELTELTELAEAGESASAIDLAAPLSEILGSDHSVSIQEAIMAQYPYLFEMGNLTRMIETLSDGTELDEATAVQIEALLTLDGLDDIPGFSVLTESTQVLIQQLNLEIMGYQAQLERETARRTQLIADRDRTAAAYEALSNKLVELELQRAASNREVGLGILAIVPEVPLGQSGITLYVAATAVGSLVLGIILVVLAHFLGTKPLLGTPYRRYT